MAWAKQALAMFNGAPTQSAPPAAPAQQSAASPMNRFKSVFAKPVQMAGAQSAVPMPQYLSQQFADPSVVSGVGTRQVPNPDWKAPATAAAQAPAANTGSKMFMRKVFKPVQYGG
jgi:hypothetical protein